MDALALLCTLHAEGPSTLVRLRSAGFGRIDDLLRSSAEEVAAAIDFPIARAERLLREARLLIDRVERLEPEEELAPAVEARLARAPAGDVSLASRRGDPSFRMGPRVLEPGSRIERPAEPATAVSTPIATGSGDGRGERGSADGDPACVPGGNATDELETLLEHGLLDELDVELGRALAAAGVRTARELVAASGLSLSRKVGVPFTRLLELQLRAQRLLETALPPAPARGKALVPSAPDAAAPRALQYRRFTDRAPARIDRSPAASHEAAGPFA